MTTQEIPGERELQKHVPQLSFLDTLADELAGSICSVFGTPVEREGVTVIPVAKARWGMGGGTGAQRGSGSEAGSDPGIGGGGGAMVKPLGFIELSDGRTRFRAIRDPGLSAFAAIAGGFLGLSALRAIAGTRRTSSRVRSLIGRRRRSRRLRKLFR